jgi:hypothetical protein
MEKKRKVKKVMETKNLTKRMEKISHLLIMTKMILKMMFLHIILAAVANKATTTNSNYKYL